MQLHVYAIKYKQKIKKVLFEAYSSRIFTLLATKLKIILQLSHFHVIATRVKNRNFTKPELNTNTTNKKLQLYEYRQNLTAVALSRHRN